MPEVLRTRGFRFFFFSREAHEPRHIHVERAEKYGKFWLEPIELAKSRGFRSHELLPALKRARASAQRTTCLNNLRQINLGLRTDADDSDDKTPRPGRTGGDTPTVGVEISMTGTSTLRPRLAARWSLSLGPQH